MLKFQTVDIRDFRGISRLFSPFPRAQSLAGRGQQDIADDSHIGHCTIWSYSSGQRSDMTIRRSINSTVTWHRNPSSGLKLFNIKKNVNLRHPTPSDHGPIRCLNARQFTSFHLGITLLGLFARSRLNRCKKSSSLFPSWYLEVPSQVWRGLDERVLRVLLWDGSWCHLLVGANIRDICGKVAEKGRSKNARYRVFATQRAIHLSLRNTFCFSWYGFWVKQN